MSFHKQALMSVLKGSSDLETVTLPRVLMKIQIVHILPLECQLTFGNSV